MGLLATSQFYFRVPRVEVSQVRVFCFKSNGGRAVTSVDRLQTLDLHQYCRAFVLIHLLYCAAMFFIFMIFEYFWLNS
jgi:hypothetical protein